MKPRRPGGAWYPALVFLAAVGCRAYDRGQYAGLLDAAETGADARAADAADVVSADRPAVGDDVTLETDALADAPSDARTDSPADSDAGAGVDAGSDVGSDVAPPIVTVSFQDGVEPTAAYVGTGDAYISEATPAMNYGGRAELRADGNTTSDRSILLRWDLSTIPAAITVMSATITVHVVDGTVATYPIFEISREWREFEATWLSAYTGQAWTMPGALGADDRGTSLLGSLGSITTGETRTINLNATGVALVQRWADTPTANHGIVVSTNAAADGLQIASREAALADQRPRLTVTYRAR